MPNTFKFHLKTSRPGLWFPTLWLYVVPTAGMDIWGSIEFWVGLFYFTFPFNYLIYSWNDFADIEIDAQNPRKNRWYGTLLFLNYIYNNKKLRVSGRPPFELLVSLGYLLALTLSIQLNHLPKLPLYTYLYLILFAIQSHLIGEVMDIDPDKAGGRRTTATVLGYRYSKLLLAFIISIEAYLLLSEFTELFLGGFLAVYALYMTVDGLFIFKNKPYPLHLVKFFGICANIAALATMVWLWITAKGSFIRHRKTVNRKLKTKFMARSREQQDIPKAKINKESLQKAARLFSYAGNQKWKFVLGFVFLILTGSTSLIFPYLTGDLVDAVTMSSNEINRIDVAEITLAAIRTDVYKNLIRQPMLFFTQRRVGELTSRLSADTSQIHDTFTGNLAQLVRQVITIAGGIVMLFFINIEL
eukprot:gene35336-47487_t